MIYSIDQLNSLLERPLNVEILNTIDSTNSELRRRLQCDCSNVPDVLLAYHQTAGRGRQGKSFYSPDHSGIYMTMRYHSGGQAHLLHLTSKTAVCVCKAIRFITGAEAEIKWVNDIYVNDHKICGILCENILTDVPGQSDVLIGIGINVGTKHFPEDVKNAASIPQAESNPEALIADILNRLYPMLDAVNDTTFLQDYRNLSCVLGREVTYFINGEQFSGTALSIDQNGYLYVQSDDRTMHCLNSGEISLRF